MRLLNFLSYSNINNVINNFRTMNISLVSSSNPNEILNEIKKLYDISKIEKILLKLNKELKKVYTGKYSFGLCDKFDKKIDDIILNKRKIDLLTLSLFNANEELAHIKTELEENFKK